MQEINLYDLIKFYVKKWPYFLIALLVGALLGAVYTHFVQKPSYVSKATLLVVGAQRPASSQESVALNNYLELFKSHRVLSPVILEKSYDGSYEKLARNVTAKNEKNTDIMKVSIASDNPGTSQALLDGAIQSFRVQVKELYGASTLTISTVDRPNYPAEASNVNPVKQIGLSILVSFFLMLIALFFFYDYKQSIDRLAPRKRKKVTGKTSSRSNEKISKKSRPASK